MAMINYQQKRYWKIFLLVLAVFISLGSLLYTNILVRKLSADQRKTVSLLADAYKQINIEQMKDEVGDLSFLFRIIKTNETIPLILCDSKDNIIDHRNLDSAKVKRPGYLLRQLNIMKSKHKPIYIYLSVKNQMRIYYKDSKLLNQLKVYPFIQLMLVILFILIAYFAFNSSQKYEQNKVWIGLSKETAHQLGTPVSSLMALSENIKAEKGKISQALIDELEKDIHRLAIITDRFSRIGSVPKFEEHNIHEMVKSSIDYLRPRISQKVSLEFAAGSDEDLIVHIIPSLFDWVIENLCKNAVNAMEGKGKITINIMQKSDEVVIDISDTGKGIPRTKYQTIFQPGYTTSKMGWGLGLTLCKRIIENYHKGFIYVKHSEINKGTTFRIKLPL